MQWKRVISLTRKDYIAQGTNRACYIDPDNLNRCIKVTISKDFSESKKEIKYYEFLKKRGVSFKFIANYYGVVETSLGDGAVFDLVRDFNGEISKTLSSYLQKDELTKEILNPIVLLKELREFTSKEKIVVKDLNTKNMLYQKIDEKSGKLILIDGVINNDFLFYSNYFDFLVQKKIDKLWNNFEKSLSTKYSHNHYFIKLLDF